MKSVLLLIVLIATASARMQLGKTKLTPGHLTFGPPEITAIPNKYRYHASEGPVIKNVKPGQVGVDVDTIVNIAEDVWNFIQQNQPVINISENYANAVPQGISNWTQLENWQDPVSNCFQIEYKNLFQITVVSFSYCVVFTPGGDYQGEGQYLNQVQIAPSDISASLGYTLDAVTSVPSVINSGSSSNPIAGAEVHMKFMVSSVLKKDVQEHIYFVKGDGTFSVISQ